MSDLLVEAHGLTKRYGTFAAVDSLNLELRPGEVYGFLGPNGSGKSTTILMLLGLTEPTAGEVTVLGRDPTREAKAVKRQIGYLPEAVGFYGDLSGKSNLLFTAELNGMHRSDAESRVLELMDTVQLVGAVDQPVRQYSRGMRQRLGLADVLLKEPRLVILDDPTLGLDPAGVQWLLALIEEMSTQRGITVFLSSHQLHQVQRVCHRVGIMSRGELVLEGSVSELMAQTEGGGFEVRLEARGGEGLLDRLRALPGVTRVEQVGAHTVVSSEHDVRAHASAAVLASGAELLEVQSSNRTLEDIYLRYFLPEDAA